MLINHTNVSAVSEYEFALIYDTFLSRSSFSPLNFILLHPGKSTNINTCNNRIMSVCRCNIRLNYIHYIKKSDFINILIMTFRRISEYFWIRDSSLIPNIMRFEYASHRGESRYNFDSMLRNIHFDILVY